MLPGASKQEAEQKQSWEGAGDTLRSKDSRWRHPRRGSCFVPQLSIIGNSLCGACHPCWSVFPVKRQTWSSAGGVLSCWKHEEVGKGGEPAGLRAVGAGS